MTAVVGALAGVTVTAAPTVAAPQPSAPVFSAPDRPISWLAAGDSYSSGQGLVYEVGACAQAREQGQGEPGAWGVEAADLLKGGGKLSLEANSPDLVACTSATTANFLNSQLGNPPQWQKGDPRYDLVSFTFGGDNVHFANVVEECLGLNPAGIISGTAIAWEAALLGPIIGRAAAAKEWAANPFVHCPSDAVLRGEIKDLVPTYKSFLLSVADQAVTPGGNIVVLGYPELVEDPALWSAVDKDADLCQGIRRADARELRGLAGDLNATIAGVVNTVNAEHPNDVTLTYVDVNTGDPSLGIPYNDQNLFEPSTGARHNLCAAEPWLNGITVQFHGVSLPDIHHSFHPNEAGNDAMARLVEEIFPHLDWSRFWVAEPQILPHPAQLVDVTCATVDDCWGVGDFGNPPAGSNAGAQPLVVHDSGGRWTVVSTPVVNTGEEIETASLSDVGCVSATNCWAVGGGGGADNHQPLIEHFTGTSWTLVGSPAVGGGDLDGVACVSATDCWAVGSADIGSNEPHPLIERYTGAAWTLVSSPPVSDGVYTGLASVTCPSSSDCWAVGETSNSVQAQMPLIEQFNGTGWSVVNGASAPASPIEFGLSSISCPTTNDCWAVGDRWATNAPSDQPFIEQYDGHAWSIVASPNISGGAMLNGITCQTSDDCWTVGWTENDPGGGLTEQYSGGSWDVIDSPAILYGGGLDGVTCASATDCFAVGSGSNGDAGAGAVIETNTTP